MLIEELEVAEEDGAHLIALLQELALPINRFFETTMVMSEVEDVRYARLSLMAAASQQLLSVGDLSVIVIEG